MSDLDDMFIDGEQRESIFVRGSIIDRELERSSDIPVEFGICSHCERFFYMEYEHGNYEAICMQNWEYPRSRNKTRKVCKCSAFVEAGAMSLNDMKELALEINLKEKLGFKGE
jgi:hypothetical protein